MFAKCLLLLYFGMMLTSDNFDIVRAIRPSEAIFCSANPQEEFLQKDTLYKLVMSSGLSKCKVSVTHACPKIQIKTDEPEEGSDGYKNQLKLSLSQNVSLVVKPKENTNRPNRSVEFLFTNEGTESIKIQPVYIQCNEELDSEVTQINPPATKEMMEVLGYTVRRFIMNSKKLMTRTARKTKSELFAIENMPCRKNDVIAIIGANPTGIHMAYLLTKIGFTNVTIYEKSNDIAKDFKEVQIDKITYDSDNIDLVIGPTYDALKDVGILEEIGFIKASNFTPFGMGLLNVWRTDNYKSYTVHNEYQDVISKAKEVLQDAPLDTVIKTFFGKLLRYIKIHMDIFPTTKYGILPEPLNTFTKFKLMKQNFHDFLEENDLLTIENLFQQMIVIIGYGSTEEISALDGLTYASPKYIIDMLSHKTGNVNGGYRRIWTSLVKKNMFNIKLNSTIKSVSLPKNATSKIRLYLEGGISKYVDFVIWSDSFEDATAKFDKLDEKALNLLKTPRHSHMATAVMTLKNFNSFGAVQHFFLKNPDSPSNFFMIGRNQFKGQHVKKMNETVLLLSIFNIGDAYGDVSQIKRIVTRQFALMGATVVSIDGIQFKKHSPKWLTDEEDITPWDLLRIQGRQNVWFTGREASFDSDSIKFRYNELLVENIKQRCRSQ